jgi:hypothetical protein
MHATGSVAKFAYVGCYTTKQRHGRLLDGRLTPTGHVVTTGSPSSSVFR